MALYGNPQITGVERRLDQDDLIVSKTDLEGKIVYGNRTFYKFAGLDESQCLGIQHNLIRHPDMPRSVFKYLWDTLKSGHELFAYVINRAANGDHYWVFAHVTPSRDTCGNTVGYHSNRRAPNRQVIDEHITPFYRSLLQIEKQAPSPQQGLEAARSTIEQKLAESRMSFNELMYSLGV